MKKFDFRLEKVLKLRQGREEEIQVLLAQARDRYNNAIDQLERLQAHREKIAHQLENFKENPYGIEDLLIYQGYIETLDRQIGRQYLQTVKLGEEVQNVRNQLMEASRDKKMIETVKTRHHQRYKDEQRRAENCFFDEVGSIQCARKLIREQ